MVQMSLMTRGLSKARQTRPRRVLAVVAAACVVVLPGVAAHAADAPASPDPAGSGLAFTDYMDAKTYATMRKQEALQPAVQAIWEEQARNPKSGFAGLAVEGDGVTLYWKGALTAGMQAAVAAGRRAGPVTVKPALHSDAELHAESAKIHKRIQQLGATDIQRVDYATDGSGLTVVRQPAAKRASLAAARQLRGKALIVPADQLVAQAGVTVPVRFDTATEEIRPSTTRFTDFSPWNGGGKWVNASKNLQCTTGFGVHRNGHSYVLTAAHCASAGDTVQSADGTYMGPVYIDDWRYDILLIDTPGWHIIFDGPRDTTSTKNVNSWGTYYQGGMVCQSGQISGTVCNLRMATVTDIVVSKRTPDSDGDWGYTMYDLVMAFELNGGISNRGGDSGGPVFSLDGTGVRAMGITSAGADTPELYFQDWGSIANRLGAYPNTSSTIS
jgi:hypothetical protein